MHGKTKIKLPKNIKPDETHPPRNHARHSLILQTLIGLQTHIPLYGRSNVLAPGSKPPAIQHSRQAKASVDGTGIWRMNLRNVRTEKETSPKDFAVTASVTYLCKWQSENGRDLIRSGWGGDRRKRMGMKSELVGPTWSERRDRAFWRQKLCGCQIRTARRGRPNPSVPRHDVPCPLFQFATSSHGHLAHEVAFHDWEREWLHSQSETHPPSKRIL